jgi:hypothetical protein
MEEFALKISTRFVVLSLFGIMLFFGVLHYFLSNSLFDESSVQAMLRYSHKHSVLQTINSPLFWTSSIGVPLKIMIEVVIAALFLKIGAIFSQINLTFKTLLFITIVCYVLFLIQMVAETIYIEQLISITEFRHLDNFSLFSISFFLQMFGSGVPGYLNHMFQVISLFEICFWFLLVFSISKVGSISMKDASTVVLFYVFILLIWLLVISIITLLV